MADVLVVGPGLGQSDWSRNALKRLQQSDKPTLWDADALNLLALNPHRRQNWVLTPHPGEAARLLGCRVVDIESDRLLSARNIVKQYGGVVVLKGAGTLIANEQGEMAIADVGNAGMASGGMGDILSGIIGGLIAQSWRCMMPPARGVSCMALLQISWLKFKAPGVYWPQIYCLLFRSTLILS